MDTTIEAGDLAAEIGAVQAFGAAPDILDIVLRETGTGFAAIACLGDVEDLGRGVVCAGRAGPGSGWASKPGRGGAEAVETVLRDALDDWRAPVAIADTSVRPRWRDHSVVRRFGIQCWLSAPIARRDGTLFGALCAIDMAPRALDRAETCAMVCGFAELIGRALDGHAAQRATRPAAAPAALPLDRESVPRLRDEFVAVLGHDLRSPLASLASGLRVLGREQMDERPARILAQMQATIGRMDALIDNLLDLARRRVGHGLAVEIAACDDLGTEIAQVVAEIRVATGREIALDWQAEGVVHCDSRRIGRLASNLLGNAVRHGDPAAPIRVEGRLDGASFCLAVENGGDPIPPARIERLFRPFRRGADGADIRASGAPDEGADGPGQGLGLGLYISREIARAHGGTLDLESAAGRTRATLVIPT